MVSDSEVGRNQGLVSKILCSCFRIIHAGHENTSFHAYTAIST